MNTRHDMWRPSRGANLHMSRFVSHPAGAELGGVGEIADTTKENQCAYIGAGEEPPSVAYESDAVRRLDTTPPPPAGSGDGRSRRGGQIGGVCLFVGVDSARRPHAGRAGGSSSSARHPRDKSEWGGVVAVIGNLCRKREKNGNHCRGKRTSKQSGNRCRKRVKPTSAAVTRENTNNAGEYDCHF